ncbi:MAG: hypothetical protein R6V17_09255 [Halanaerobacter sp.]
MSKESAYILLEVLITTALLALIISLLAVLNTTALNLWSLNIDRVSLARESLISLEMIINLIEDAKAVQDIQEEEITLLTPSGEWMRLYYKSGVGLCWGADNNIIQKGVKSLEFTVLNSSLLIIELVVEEEGRTKKLSTGIEI